MMRYKRVDGEVVRLDPMEGIPQHEDFEEYWDAYGDFLWWCARKAAKILGGSSEDYIGFMVLRMNRGLRTFDPMRTNFTTYFCANMLADTIKYVLRYDSEYWSWICWCKRTENDPELRKIIYDSDLANYYLYRPPEGNHEWVEEIRKCFNCDEDLWRFLCRGIDKRWADMTYRKYKWGHSLQQIGNDYGITRERVRQIVSRSLDHMKKRVGELGNWVKLFKIQDKELGDYTFPEPQFGDARFFGDKDDK